MRIVHYTLGIYPNRTGGLNRYATDLAREQSKIHQVSLLIPGGWCPLHNRCSISTGKIKEGLKRFKLINALPQPLLLGTRNPEDFMKMPISEKSFERFFDTVKPEVLHIHTLMGLPEDALIFFKNKGVKIIFTSHDYFGICPKVNLINHNGELCQGPLPESCALCNAGSPATLYLRIRSSNLAFTIRDLLRWLKSTLNF